MEKFEKHPRASLLANALATPSGQEFLQARLGREAHDDKCPWGGCGWPVAPLVAKAESGPTAKPGKEVTQVVEREGDYVRYADACTSFRVAELRDEINLMNLLNGLYLSDEQMLKLLVLAEEANRRRKTCVDEVAKANHTIVEAVASMDRAAEAGRYAERSFDEGTWPKAARSCVRAAEQIAKAHGGVEPDLVELEEQVEEVLTEGQEKIVEAYKSCLIPTKDMKDPLRIGQAQSDEPRFEAQLEAVRKAPPEKMEAVLGKAIDDVIGYQMYEGSTFTKKQRDEEEKRLSALFLGAKKLSEVEYHLQAKDVSGKMEEAEKDRKAKEDAIKRKAERQGTGNAISSGKMAHFLLHPKAARILAERLSRSKSFKGSAKIDLDSLEAADTCNGGKCAID